MENSATRINPSRPSEKSVINTAGTAPRKASSTGIISMPLVQYPIGNAQLLSVKYVTTRPKRPLISRGRIRILRYLTKAASSAWKSSTL